MLPVDRRAFLKQFSACVRSGAVWADGFSRGQD